MSPDTSFGKRAEALIFCLSFYRTIEFLEGGDFNEGSLKYVQNYFESSLSQFNDIVGIGKSKSENFNDYLRGLKNLTNLFDALISECPEVMSSSEEEFSSSLRSYLGVLREEEGFTDEDKEGLISLCNVLYHHKEKRMNLLH